MGVSERETVYRKERKTKRDRARGGRERERGRVSYLILNECIPDGVVENEFNSGAVHN